MQAVALILALAVITGCNARAVRQADATPSWEDSVNRFWQYVADLNDKAEGAVKDLKASQLSRELDTLITDSMAELTAYRDELQTKLAPYTDASTGQLSQDLQLLANRLQKDMVDAKDRSTEYLGELKTMVEQNSDDVHGRITTYTNKLKKRLNKDTEEIRNTVATYLGELHSRTTQNLDAVKEQVEPYVQQASETANQKLSDISTLLMTQAEGLGKQLEDQAEGIKTQLEATAQDLRTSLEGKIDELTQMLSPYATQLREQIENVMDKRATAKMRLYLAIAVLMLALVAYTEAQEETFEQKFAKFTEQVTQVGQNLGERLKTGFDDIQTSDFATNSPPPPPHTHTHRYARAHTDSVITQFSSLSSLGPVSMTFLSG
ncbi:hypothetical protein ABVT39_023839 [Epinephelus coioides]